MVDEGNVVLTLPHSPGPEPTANINGGAPSNNLSATASAKQCACKDLLETFAFSTPSILRIRRSSCRSALMRAVKSGRLNAVDHVKRCHVTQ